MLDKIASALGYVRKSSSVEVDAELALATPTSNVLAHRIHEQKFDYARVQDRYSQWGFGYSEGDTYHFALGKDDWLPITVACALFSREPIKLLSEGLEDSWWLAPVSATFTEWQKANCDLMRTFVGRLERVRPECDDPTRFAALGEGELGHIFEYVYRTTNARTSSIALSSSEAGEAFYRHPAMTALRAALGAALPAFLSSAMDWMEARGCVVDRESQLVKLDGYQALFLVEDQSF